MEAGLGFTCRKTGHYIGKEVVDKQRKDGVKRKLAFLTIDAQVRKPFTKLNDIIYITQITILPLYCCIPNVHHLDMISILMIITGRNVLPSYIIIDYRFQFGVWKEFGETAK